MYQIVSNSAIKLNMYTSEEPTDLAPASVSLTIANVRPWLELTVQNIFSKKFDIIFNIIR